MKAEVMMKTEIEVKYLVMTVGVRYEDEDMPLDFPHRSNNSWSVTIDIDSGQILEWPSGEELDLYMKVCDLGFYNLLNPNRESVASIENGYVPHGLVPGECGDYIDLKISPTGLITNWPKPDEIDLGAFFGEDED